MTATITDIVEYRDWKRAKEAWNAVHPERHWSRLTETERLNWRRMFFGQ